MEKSKESIEFEKYLESIGGLTDAWKKKEIKNRYFFQCGDGWLKLIQELIDKLIDLKWNKNLCQVKEKFGSLRFYIDHDKDEHPDLISVINQYSRLSLETCEYCGKEGKGLIDQRKINNGWIKTLCSNCHDKLTNDDEEYGIN